jgi:hypothetical protein
MLCAFKLLVGVNVDIVAYYSQIKAIDCFYCDVKAFEHDGRRICCASSVWQHTADFQDNMRTYYTKVKIGDDVYRFLEENYWWTLKEYINCIDWWHISDVLAGFSRFGRK